MLLRRALPPVVVAAALLLSAAPASASGGGGGNGSGGGGGTSAPPTTPAVQLQPDAPTLASGASDVVQVVLNPRSPAAGETLSVSASNSALTVPATVPVVGSSFDAQFGYTAGAVTKPTPVTVTVTSPAGSGSFTVTVTPAATPTAASITAFPAVVASGDAVTVTASLLATTPPGGTTVALHSDTAAFPLPASVVIPAGASSASVPVTVGTVAAATTAQFTETLGATTVTGQIKIDPSRVLTGLTLSAASVDGALGATGQVSISVPADGDTFSVTLHSSNPAVASVPATVGFGDQDATSGFAVATTQVRTPTNVTITATHGAATFSQVLTVTPTPPPPFDVAGLTVAPAVVAGTGSATGTLTTTAPTPAGGATISLSSSNTKLASVPTTVFVPAGATTATFPVKTTGQSTEDVSIGETFHNLGHAAPLGITPAKGGNLIPAFATNQVLEVRHVNDGRFTLGFYSGGDGSVESGQLPPGVSLINNLRPGEFVFQGSPQKPGTYTFVLKFTGNGVATPYALAYVWTVLP